MGTLTRLLVVLALSACPFLMPPSADADAPKVCNGCNFSRAELQGVTLQRAVYVGTTFHGANLRDANLRDARFTGVDFTNADLRGADLRGAELTGCTFTGAKLAGAKLDGVRATGVQLRDLDVDEAVLRGFFAHCTGCNAEGLELAGKDLSGITVIGVNFRNVRARGTHFAHADISGDFRGADLRDADFRGASICWHNSIEERGATAYRETACIDLRDAHVAGANFEGTLLCDRTRDGRTCSPVDAATLRRYSHASLDGARLP